MKMTFDEWYYDCEDINYADQNADNYFDTIISIGCIVDHTDIKVYMQLAWNAAMQQQSLNDKYTTKGDK